MDQENIRNLAIVAHVDHGKTTLIDAFLKQSNLFRENSEEMEMDTLLDTGELEREKGITIKAKNASIKYKDTVINLIDTPGHADFGGEVERTLNMADGCLLLVDAAEGVMPQTRFVLQKALELQLTPIVVLNKIDKPNANCAETVSSVQDLFLELASTEEQLEFPVLYAIGKDGKVWEDEPTNTDEEASVEPLLDTVVQEIPHPSGEIDAPLQMQISSIDYDPHTGVHLIGKIQRGKISVGDNVVVAKPEDGQQGEPTKGKVKHVFVKQGLLNKQVDNASVGEVVEIAGIDSKEIGATLCSPEKVEPLPKMQISDPSVRIKIEANTSPLLGKEGTYVTSKQIQARLEKEAQNNVSLKIEIADSGAFYVAGRGDLQLAILIEELRREGYEFQVSRPEVMIKEIEGKKHEPLEDLYLEVPEEYGGAVMNEVNSRKGELIDMETKNGRSKMHFEIRTANLLGLRNNLLTETKGDLVMTNYLSRYVPYTKQEEFNKKGSIISSHAGTVASYSLNTIQERGELFVEPGTQVYEGMVIGRNKFEQDLEVNPTKERQKTNARRSTAEVTQIQLKGIKELTLEYALLSLAEDEILEVTPENLRPRKLYLKSYERAWAKKRNLPDYAKQQLGEV